MDIHVHNEIMYNCLWNSLCLFTSQQCYVVAILFIKKQVFKINFQPFYLTSLHAQHSLQRSKTNSIIQSNGHIINIF